MNSLDNICIIPARGGSKRIPKKNIIEFFGKPLISYSIEIALSSNLFKRVIVSTDCLEIKKISKQYGAEVPFLRSDKNSDDFSTTSDVILEFIEKLNLKNESICCLYPTAIFCDIFSLNESYNKLIKGNFSTLVPIVQYSYPIERALRIKGNLINFLDENKKNTRTQDCEKLFHDAGQWYWIQNAKRFNTIYTENTGFYIIEENRSQDIDTYVDLELAKIKYEYLQSIKNK